jgi:hypothetical protein
LAGAEGIVTLSDAVGTPEGFQFVDTFQAVLVVPVQVFCENALIEIINPNAHKKVVIFFIVKAL